MRPALTLPALNRLVGLITAVGVIGVATVAQGQPHPYNPYWADGFNSGTYQPRDAFSEKWLEAPNFRREAFEEAYESDDARRLRVPPDEANVPAMRAPDPSPWDIPGDSALQPGSPRYPEPGAVAGDPNWADDYWRDDYWADQYWGDEYWGDDYWVDDYWLDDRPFDDPWADDYWADDYVGDVYGGDVYEGDDSWGDD